MTRFQRIRICQAFAVALLGGCSTIDSQMATLETPGETRLRETSVSADARGDGILSLTLRNLSSARIDISISLAPTVIGKETITSRVLSGYRQETVCEGDVCGLENVPIYAEVKTEQAVSGIFEAVPAHLGLEGGQEAIAVITLVNHSQATAPFVLLLRMTITDDAGTETLTISCGSDRIIRRRRG